MRASVQSKVAIAFFLGLDSAVAGEVAAVPMERQREAEERTRPPEMRAMEGKAMMRDSKNCGEWR